jgi:hypothetical protein
MAEFELDIHIDQQYVRQFNTSGYKLCVAAGVQSGSTVYFNVVAYSTHE